MDTISVNQQVEDGQTLVSAGGVFELGFFSPNGSQDRYVGIWYNGLPNGKVAWVANSESPLIGSSGVLMIGSDGNVVIVDGKSRHVWSTNVSLTSNDTVAVLSDKGNLVLMENKLNGSVLWESFDHPSDSILPGIKIGLNTRTGKQIVLTSWKDVKNPSLGSFVGMLDPQEVPQMFILNGLVKRVRTGQWNGRSFIGVPKMTRDINNGFNLLKDNLGETLYFTYVFFNYSNPTLLFLDSLGALNQMDWDAKKRKWSTYQVLPDSPCDLYNTCGPFGSCKSTLSPMCKCLKGYEPKSITEWNNGNWTSGCVRKSRFQCEGNVSSNDAKGDVFFPISGMKLPDFAHYLLTRSKIECEALCLKNCSCLAYAYAEGIGCMIWGKDMIDLQEFSFGGEQLYIRLTYSELDVKRKTKALIVIIISATVGLILMAGIFYLLKTRIRGIGSIITFGNRRIASKESSVANMLHNGFSQGSSSELPFFSFQSIQAATNNFCIENKLGEGGFGPVYQGILQNGHKVAIKRLSSNSGQGVEEFTNEVILISKLQHRNLVKLMGFCVHDEEKLLIYEYMPNRSLDFFIFGSSSSDKTLLNWDQRYNIIEGIARGLLYLHRDSRLKIIHRDLKTSNILLDKDINPKISDFGLARIFGGNQTIANTSRVVGTYGYMSPEYAMQGMFSEKSDVFSFGVILLEIISGKRNCSYNQSKDSLNPLDHAWQLWKEGKAEEFLDAKLADSSNTAQVVRCIQVGLLCVQEHAKDRPNTAAIVFMLCNDTVLPSPELPAYNGDRNICPDGSYLSLPCSTNYISTSIVHGR